MSLLASDDVEVAMIVPADGRLYPRAYVYCPANLRPIEMQRIASALVRGALWFAEEHGIEITQIGGWTRA